MFKERDPISGLSESVFGSMVWDQMSYAAGGQIQQKKKKKSALSSLARTS